MMKHTTITAVILIVLSANVFSQVPRTISFQGVLTDASGNLIPDGNHTLTLKLYDNVAAPTPIFTESQTVPVVKGVFNVIIGSVTALPASLAFDRAYFLGVAVDGGLELAPRTALTAVPYALRADRANIAEALTPNATGVVTSINNQSGALTMQGGGGTTVTNVGNTFTISSVGGGGTGIQGVQSTDGTIAIQNPNGPIANLGIAANSITSDKIADGAITASDIASGVIPNATNFITNGSTAGGDLTGSYPNPQVMNGAITTNKLGDNAVTATKIASGHVVKSINGLTDAVTLSAGANVTLNPSGNTITISATGGAGGIQTLQSTNSTLDILNANGPVTTVNVGANAITSAHIADNAVTSAKIADASVTTGKINSTGAVNGQVLTYNGTNVAWSSVPAGGGTLDQAYDFGGAGNGRTIVANAGAVMIAGEDGFISTGTYGSGANIPVSGAGTRMFFYPKKAAFRAGIVDGNQWDDANIGEYSTAIGYNTIASGNYATAIGRITEASGSTSFSAGYNTTASGPSSTAMGGNTTASSSYSTAMGYATDATGQYSTAMGNFTTASGQYSTAMGNATDATGNYSTAMGHFTIAGGQYSTAMGSYVTAATEGSFAIGDKSTNSTNLSIGTTNRFAARFANGYYLYTESSGESGVGARLQGGATSWSSISDSTKKEHFILADEDEMLLKFRTLRLGSWNYKNQDPMEYRHYGPMAQEWFSAFGHDGIGTIGNDTTLATADVDGVLCIAIQALEKRTSEQKETIRALETMVREQMEIIRRNEKQLVDHGTMIEEQQKLIGVLLKKIESSDSFTAERHSPSQAPNSIGALIVK